MISVSRAGLYVIVTFLSLLLLYPLYVLFLIAFSPVKFT